MHPTTARVATALQAAGIDTEVRELDATTRTAQQAADALGVPVGAIVKSLCFIAGGEPLMLLVSGVHRVDVEKVRVLLGVPSVLRATADEVRTATGYAIGGVPPLGHVRPLRMLVDRHLLDYELLWAAAGTPNSVFRITPRQLVDLTGGRTDDIAEERPA